MSTCVYELGGRSTSKSFRTGSWRRLSPGTSHVRVCDRISQVTLCFLVLGVPVVSSWTTPWGPLTPSTPLSRHSSLSFLLPIKNRLQPPYLPLNVTQNSPSLLFLSRKVRLPYRPRFRVTTLPTPIGHLRLFESHRPHLLVPPLPRLLDPYLKGCGSQKDGPIPLPPESSIE